MKVAGPIEGSLSLFGSTTLWSFDQNRPLLMDHSLRRPTETGFQTDTPKPRSDWLTLYQSFPYWPRAISSQSQFENPPW